MNRICLHICIAVALILTLSIDIKSMANEGIAVSIKDGWNNGALKLTLRLTNQFRSPVNLWGLDNHEGDRSHLFIVATDSGIGIFSGISQARSYHVLKTQRLEAGAYLDREFELLDSGVWTVSPAGFDKTLKTAPARWVMAIYQSDASISGSERAVWCGSAMAITGDPDWRLLKDLKAPGTTAGLTLELGDLDTERGFFELSLKALERPVRFWDQRSLLGFQTPTVLLVTSNGPVLLRHAWHDGISRLSNVVTITPDAPMRIKVSLFSPEWKQIGPDFTTEDIIGMMAFVDSPVANESIVSRVWQGLVFSCR